MSTQSIVLRIQSPEGTKRIDVKYTDPVETIFKKAQMAFGIPSSTGWKLYRNRNKTNEIKRSSRSSVRSLKLSHGDQIYLFSEEGVLPVQPPLQSIYVDDDEMSESAPAKSKDETMKKKKMPPQEDELDAKLKTLDIKAELAKNITHCNHPPSNKCINCMDVDPFNEEYLLSLDPPIKHLSFHAYLRKLQNGSSAKFVVLEDTNCTIKPGCSTHPPWPRGICSKCQPSTVMLSRQTYRHVDNVMFENPLIVERFLNFWRKTGNQRIGFLYGNYEYYANVPLGIRAVVKVIYEPPQISDKDHIELLEDPYKAFADEIANRLNMKSVGWIFTDLIATANTNEGTVKYVRGDVSSYFLSAEECIMAANFQNMHPNPCKLARNGIFGSRFVTIVVTGDVNCQIHFDGYQVSNQCMALVRDGCLIPTIDAPELAYVKESTSSHYVPDVYYKEKDSFGNEISKIARPLPVEYLLIDVPAAFPVEPYFSFNECSSYNKHSFVVENRSSIGETQDIHALKRYLMQFPEEAFLEMARDFHFLLFLACNEWVPFKETVYELIDIIMSSDANRAYKWKEETEEWQMLMHLAEFAEPENTWACLICTYRNPKEQKNCMMCSSAREQ